MEAAARAEAAWRFPALQRKLEARMDRSFQVVRQVGSTLPRVAPVAIPSHEDFNAPVRTLCGPRTRTPTSMPALATCQWSPHPSSDWIAHHGVVCPHTHVYAAADAYATTASPDDTLPRQAVGRECVCRLSWVAAVRCTSHATETCAAPTLSLPRS